MDVAIPKVSQKTQLLPLTELCLSPEDTRATLLVPVTAAPAAGPPALVSQGPLQVTVGIGAEGSL